MKKIMSIMTLAVALFLTACSQQEKATQTSSKQTSSSSQTVTSASEGQKEGVSTITAIYGHPFFLFFTR